MGWKEQTHGCLQRAGDAHHCVCCLIPQSVTRAGLPPALILPPWFPLVRAKEAMQVKNGHVVILFQNIFSVSGNFQIRKILSKEEKKDCYRLVEYSSVLLKLFFFHKNQVFIEAWTRINSVTCLRHHISTKDLGDLLILTYQVFKYLITAIQGD